MMKHTNAHKLSYACLDCVKKHIEHKERLLKFVSKIAYEGNIGDWTREIEACAYPYEAQKLLAEIKADEDD